MKLSFFVSLLLARKLDIATSLSSKAESRVGRRSFIVGSCIASSTAFSSGQTAWAVEKISLRLDQDILNLPAPSYANELNGVDNTYFPIFLQGTWNVTQILVATTTPLGMKYVGGPNGDLSIAEKTMTEARSKIGMPVQLQLRYLPTKWGVAEDRIFNTKARLNGFAGKNVVASVEYADVGGSNRRSLLALGGSENDPLQTTLTSFKGPAAQKTFVIAHSAEKLGDTSWVGYEVQRSIFALTNQNTAPPITTDTEYIWKFDQVDSTTVK